ncbi:MAG TPA: CBS domain-containing protein [Candidatus Saccharimonadales bacterium]|nr:CBS domain-containing protein [Candidatus Saccharimonadales bacterium]
MLEVFIQLIVLVLAAAAAGLKSLRFASNGLTDFELERRVKSGDDGAKLEVEFRSMRPLLDAFRRVTVLLLSIIIVMILAATHNFVIAIVMALVWLLLVELFSTQQWLVRQAEQLSLKYEAQFLRAAQTLKPVLQILSDSRLLGGVDSAGFYSKEELLSEVDRDSQVLNKDEKLLIRQALSYQDVLVRDIMVPRSVVVTIGADDTIGPLLLDRLHKSGHSRFPVIDGDLDHIKGVLYMHDLVPLDPKSKKVGDAMSQKVYYVHQDKSLDHVLQAFLRTKHHLFMVVNEFEEVMGVVSIEDVLETIIGRKIVDEFDQYEDLRAVAKLAADERRKARKGTDA